MTKTLRAWKDGYENELACYLFSLRLSSLARAAICAGSEGE